MSNYSQSIKRRQIKRALVPAFAILINPRDKTQARLNNFLLQSLFYIIFFEEIIDLFSFIIQRQFK